jgi:hypothetical protein
MGMHLDKSVISVAPIHYKFERRLDGCQVLFVIPKAACVPMRSSFDGIWSELPQDVRTKIRLDILKFDHGYIPEPTRNNYYKVKITATDCKPGTHRDVARTMRGISDKLVAKLNEQGHTSLKVSLRK